MLSGPTGNDAEALISAWRRNYYSFQPSSRRS